MPELPIPSLWTTVALSFLLIFGVVLFLGIFVLRLLRDPIGERLAKAEGDEKEVSRLTAALAGEVPGAFNTDDSLGQDLRRAGFYRRGARHEYLALRNVFLLVTVAAAGLAAVLIGPQRQDLAVRVFFIGLAVAGIGLTVPRLILRARGRRRVVRIRRSLPDSLDMLGMCLRGGLPMRDSLQHISREILFAHKDLAVELMIVRQQADMTSLDLAFRQFAKRIDAPEVVSLSALIEQSQRLGTDVSTTVRDYADIMREKWRQLFNERASRASLQMMFPIVLCLVPATFILLMGPAALDLTDFLSGRGAASSALEQSEEGREILEQFGQ